MSSYYEHGSLEGNVPYIAFPLDLDVALEVMLSGSLTPWVGFSRWSFSAKNGCCFELHIEFTISLMQGSNLWTLLLASLFVYSILYSSNFLSDFSIHVEVHPESWLPISLSSHFQ